MSNLNKETLEILGQAFLDEFNLWEKTGGNIILPKIDTFLDKVSKFNILLFNTKKTMDDIKKHLALDAETQDSVLMFLTRVKFRFISYGGEWGILIDTLKEVSESINNDTTFEDTVAGYEQTAPITDDTMIQALLYYYTLSPNIMITRMLHVEEK